MMLLYPLVLGAQLVLVADRAPRLNVEPSCRAAASRSAVGRTAQSCMDDENRAQKKLDDQWTQFDGGDRTRCARMSSTGGQPSYVELLTCLEMAASSRHLRGRDTTGTGSEAGIPDVTR